MAFPLAPFPDLPVDIARMLLEYAAFSSRATACALVLVSRTVRAWIEPILYRVIVLDNVRSRQSFEYAIHVRDDPSFFANTVHTLLIKGDAAESIELIDHIVSSCDGITALAIWSLSRSAVAETSISASLNSLRRFATPRLSSAILSWMPRTITHLKTACEEAWQQLDMWDGLFRQCPGITHIMLDCDANFWDWCNVFIKEDFINAFQHILSVAPASLEVLVFGVFHSTTDWDALCDFALELVAFEWKRIEDDRFLVFLPTGIRNVPDRESKEIVRYEQGREGHELCGYRQNGVLDIWELADRHRSAFRESKRPSHGPGI
ncbi:hypothetical protein BDZ89DRAFT_1139581 [Hymenopellis radicata]|nr:hypothetical protein BDZ89DRAFT_1139581 [Hymenopellis radicata]